MRRRSVLLLPALAVLATAPVAVPVPAQALSCVGPRWVLEPDAEIPHVLVGRIVDARDQHLEVEVAEIWKGRRLADHVWVRLDEDLAGWYEWSDADGEVPDGYSSPRTWVMAADADFEVGVCGYWAPGRDVRRVLAPDQPEPPLTQGTQAAPAEPTAGTTHPIHGALPEETSNLPAPGMTASAVLVTLGAWWWRRRRTAST